MFVIQKTIEFDKWFRKLRDAKARARILLRFQRIEESGNFGDFLNLGDGIIEMKINYGKGYRVYYAIRENRVVLLVFGGDKSTQQMDIFKAKKIWKDIK
ncbi:MAG: type II toxin-antitoxin system RelE/ParE family toxin [Cyclobacteriaceae bacterium]|nr:type II toxin-antitoxin system RelE/ParE family toxin [Cyclobacteriaceae bacterium]